MRPSRFEFNVSPCVRWELRSECRVMRARVLWRWSNSRAWAELHRRFCGDTEKQLVLLWAIKANHLSFLHLKINILLFLNADHIQNVLKQLTIQNYIYILHAYFVYRVFRLGQFWAKKCRGESIFVLWNKAYCTITLCVLCSSTWLFCLLGPKRKMSIRR